MSTRSRTRNAATRSSYLEMLELLGGSAEDGPPPDPLERFEAAMGTRRNRRTGAPMPYTDAERDSLLRRVLADHLAHHPELAADVRRHSSACLKVRFPKTLYTEIGSAARADGTSLNTFVLTACASYLGRRAAVNGAADSRGDAGEDELTALLWEGSVR
jgi:hypothetical protein